VSKNKSHPADGWDDIQVGDLVYRTHSEVRSGIRKFYNYEMGIVIHKHGTAAVIYSYDTKQEVLVRANYLQKVEI
jgi:hypothetical protein